MIIGAFITPLVNSLSDYIKGSRQQNIDNTGKEYLRKMLNDDRFPDKWRKLETLSRVIGAGEETTKNLLIEIHARGSEKEGDA